LSIENKQQVRRAFSSAAGQYDKLARLQYQVANDLNTNWIKKDDLTGHCIDLGCGTGFLSEQLMKQTSVGELFAVDIAQPMLEQMRHKLNRFDSIQYICADAEALPFTEQSIDLIVSSLALQWCQNMTALCSGFNHLLKPQGRLIFSTFGTATLRELKQAWSVVDHYSHVNTFFSADEIKSFLSQAGFNRIAIESKIYQLNYVSVIALMQELKGIGAHNVLAQRNKQTTSKKSLQKMIAAYESDQLDNKILATYEVLFVSAQVNQ